MLPPARKQDNVTAAFYFADSDEILDINFSVFPVVCCDICSIQEGF
jgi:hypothetical protein